MSAGEYPKSEQYCLLILTDGSLSAGRWDRWRIDDNDGVFDHAPAGCVIFKDKVWAWRALSPDEDFLREEESEKERLHEEELNRHPATDPELFKYGTDIEIYYGKALKKLKKKYPWATMAQMKKKTPWEIVPKMGAYVFGQTEVIYDGTRIVHKWDEGKTAGEFIDFLCKYAEEPVKNADKDKKFSLGMDIEPYLDEAFKNVRKDHHWLTKELIKKHQYYRYTIMQLDGEWEFVRLYDKDGMSVCECGSAEDFIKSVEYDYEQLAMKANKVVASYKLSFGHVEIHGWKLESYVVSKLESGDYKADVTAGDRVTGGSREFFITPRCFEAKNYEEFLDRYLEIVPAESFGLTKKDLLADKGLKSFFGWE